MGYTTYRLHVEAFTFWTSWCLLRRREQSPAGVDFVGGWYNSARRRVNAVAINELFFTAFPEMEFDSFLTIGRTTQLPVEHAPHQRVGRHRCGP